MAKGTAEGEVNSQQLCAHGSLSEELLPKCFSDERCHLGAHSTQLVIKPKNCGMGQVLSVPYCCSSQVTLRLCSAD